eukprot:TRINITY_DN3728_c1_g1_i1.p1 TRINITY_DN3728_c1_g1~~TRINITY_DN3728_c1_g1_i1.p1  ORF type:complete len:167 (+),score=44.54 TRINITY_DN3728_c1_g1_i1:60-560(+)
MLRRALLTNVRRNTFKNITQIGTKNYLKYPIVSSFNFTEKIQLNNFSNTQNYYEEANKQPVEDDQDIRSILTDLEHATGAEREELLAELEGKQQFIDSYITGPFGTIEEPVIVKSVFDTRIVGCVGGEDEKAHDLLWHEVTDGKLTVCAECGQAFKLQKIAYDDKH